MNIVKVATHNGVFHADDVLGAVILKRAGVIEAYSDIVRTRDPKVLALCDIIFDVGGIYHAEIGRFDHHQKGGKGPDSLCWHTDGYSRSSAGLLWNEFSVHFVKADVAEEVRKSFIKHIDRVDVGESTVAFDAALTVSHAISNLNPNWDEEIQDFDGQFVYACKMVERMLQAEIYRAQAKLKAESTVHNAPVNGNILLLDKFCPWQDWVFTHVEADNILFVVHPTPDHTWMVYQVPKEKGSFAGKKALPEAWAGLRDQAIIDATGVSDAVFCHVGRFCGGARSKLGAFAMAKQAVLA